MQTALTRVAGGAWPSGKSFCPTLLVWWAMLDLPIGSSAHGSLAVGVIAGAAEAILK